MNLEEITWLDATSQGELVAAGELTSSELVDAAIARIERLNPRLNCVILPRYEQARAEARAWREGPPGPLRGVPFLMKDLLQTTAGEPFSWGWKPFRDAGMRASSTSYVAAKFAAAGLITLAQTTVPEWGAILSTETRAWGQTRNPWDPTRVAGGSSGGAAVAVASGMVPIAHANDAGGSIRIPASFCGLVGLKGSRGRTSLGPAHADLWHGLCEEGALVRTVRDAAAALDAAAGYMPGDPWMAPPPARPFREEVGKPPGSCESASWTALHGIIPGFTRSALGRCSVPLACSNLSATVSRRAFPRRSTTLGSIRPSARSWRAERRVRPKRRRGCSAAPWAPETSTRGRGFSSSGDGG